MPGICVGLLIRVPNCYDSMLKQMIQCQTFIPELHATSLKKVHTVDTLTTILPKLEKLLNINQSYITLHTFKDFQGVTGLRSQVGSFWEVGLI